MEILVRPAKATKAAHHLADVDLLIEEPKVKIVGTSIWKGRDGKPLLAVTFPAREIPGKNGAERSFFDFIRDASGNGEGLVALRKAILKAFAEQQPALARRAETDESSSAASKD
jgi:hypothetical protein